jgi:hypothetical protein
LTTIALAQRANMDVYRVTRWTRLPRLLDHFKFRRAMARMSVEGVTLDWLETGSGLTRPETKSLLSALRKMGALEVTSRESVPAVPGDRTHWPASRAPSLQRHAFLRAGLALVITRGDDAFQAVRSFVGRGNVLGRASEEASGRRCTTSDAKLSTATLPSALA